MEFGIKNTDLFDSRLYQKTVDLLKEEDNLANEKEKVYKLSVIFHVKWIHDERKYEFYKKCVEHTRSYPKKKGEDEIYDVLQFQLQQVEKALEDCSIQLQDTGIYGRSLEEENAVYVQLEEQKKEAGKGKVRVIMGDETYTREKTAKLVNEYYNNQFNKLFEIIRDKKLLAEILEIEETEDMQTLFEAYIEQYGNFFVTQAESKKLRDKLKKRIETIIKKYENNEI